MNNILVLGWYGKHNIGDESYKLAIPKLFPEASVTFSDYIDKKLIEKNDQFIMGGGDIISPKFLQEFNKINKPNKTK